MIDDIVKKHLNESSLSRIYQHIESKDSVFVIISAFQAADPKEDQRNHAQLAKDIRALGYGYIEFDSQWKYDDGTIAGEQSFFVPKMTKQDGLKLCKKYNQEAIIFKDSEGMVELRQNGSVGMKFNSSSQKQNFTQANKDLFSKLKKGSHKGKNFTFTLKEYKSVCLASAYAIVLGKQERETFTIHEETGYEEI